MRDALELMISFTVKCWLAVDPFFIFFLLGLIFHHSAMSEFEVWTEMWYRHIDRSRNHLEFVSGPENAIQVVCIRKIDAEQKYPERL